MGRWRRTSPEIILPIHGEVARSAGGAEPALRSSSPFMGRWRAAPEGPNQPWDHPPHSWGGGAQRRRGRTRPGIILPIHGEVARSAGGAEPALRSSSPFMGRWRAAPEGPNQTWDHPPHSWRGGAQRRRGRTSPLSSEVIKDDAPQHEQSRQRVTDQRAAVDRSALRTEDVQDPDADQESSADQRDRS